MFLAGRLPTRDRRPWLVVPRLPCSDWLASCPPVKTRFSRSVFPERWAVEHWTPTPTSSPKTALVTRTGEFVRSDLTWVWARRETAKQKGAFDSTKGTAMGDGYRGTADEVTAKVGEQSREVTDSA